MGIIIFAEKIPKSAKTAVFALLVEILTSLMAITRQAQPRPAPFSTEKTSAL